MLHIKKRDKVLVISGDYKGMRSEVIKVFPKKRKALVSKVNIVKKHRKPTAEKPGGIIEMEAPVDISNLMLVCPRCDQPTRPKFTFLSDGKKVRQCRRCNEIIL